MKRVIEIVIIGLIFLMGCYDTLIPPKIDIDDNKYDNLTFSNKIQLSTFPTFGSFQTSFKINLLINDTDLKIKKVKYDFTNDKNYDTTLTIIDTARTKFYNLEYNKIIASVILENDSVLSCSTDLWLTEPKIISSDGNFYYEPNIYNGNIISVTHGNRHQARFINLNTFEMDCFFCGFTSDRFTEMHCTIPSFDGKKLLFNNGENYNFCYYDLEKNDTTTIDVPLRIPRYPIGQVTWSLDNKNIYAVMSDENNMLNGIKSFNIETNQITTIYSKGNYICVVPDQNDKLAILETINNSQSKLLIFNITTKTVEKEYNDIPFNAPFRMLKDNDRVYFDGKLVFYSLSSKRTYYMQFDELDLTNHMYGEADINMEGEKFIVSTLNTKRALYEIILPRYF